MTIYEFIDEYNRHQPNGHWFERETLRFFGEDIRKMKIFKDGDYYVIFHTSENAPEGVPKESLTWFDGETFEDIRTERGLG